MITYLRTSPLFSHNLTATYYYDASGRLDYIQQFNGSIVDYGYDNADRLTDLVNRTSASADIATYHFSLDGNGNRTFIDQTEPLTPTLSPEDISYTYNDEQNRLLSDGDSDYLYDDEGQISDNDGTAYAFDYEHRLKTIDSTTTYTYDGMGNRLQAVRGGVTTRYIYDALGNLIAEADGSNNIIRYYIYGKGLMAMVTAADDIYCYHFNATGSTIALTDDSEEIVNKYAYTPFGNISQQVEAVNQPFKYVGQYGVMAEPNGLYYMRARYYDPTIGRFISEDPAGFGGGDVNLYVYVDNNPILLIDPLGLCGQTSFVGKVWNAWSDLVTIDKLPDVRIGIDSPIGGAAITVPFSSGGNIRNSISSPSINIPVAPSVNTSISIAQDLSDSDLSARLSLTTPLGGGRFNIDESGYGTMNLLSPQINFPLAPTVNAYIGLVW